MTEAARRRKVYFVTDIEADGPVPGESSMLSFATIAVGEAGDMLGEFEAVLASLPGAAPDPGTIAWFETQPEAYAAARRDPVEPAVVMRRFEAFVHGQAGVAVFAAHPLHFDASWIDHYMRRFLGKPLLPLPRVVDPLFAGGALCIRSFVEGALWPARQDGAYPAEWLGHHAHTHRAIDDARGYAHLLAHGMRLANERRPAA